MVRNSSNLVQDRKLVKKIKDGNLKIAIYGLGHVGAPLAAVWLRAGAHVIGVDNSENVLAVARKGRTVIPEPNVNEAYKIGIDTGRFELYDDPVKASRDSYFKMICVPVLSQDEGLSADLTAVSDVATMIGKGLKKNDAVSLNPSVPPGTTEDIVIPIIEKVSGLSVKSDFCMIYNPERIYEGRAIADIENSYPAILSSLGP
ncbi:MAG: nucleotide sugar dehydrogenase, partial [Nitrososphaeraceae archaeon]|nr:nucleotide sugar dehydrogenase [Nitrososphaeraceae archaeon]